MGRNGLYLALKGPNPSNPGSSVGETRGYQSLSGGPEGAELERLTHVEFGPFRAAMVYDCPVVSLCSTTDYLDLASLGPFCC